MLLEVALGADYRPGTNRGREGADIGWLFLLPRLTWPRIAFLGEPPSHLAAELRDFTSEQVVVVGRRGRSRRTPASGSAGRIVDEEALAQMPDGRPLLVVVCTRLWLERITADASLAQALRNGAVLYLLPESLAGMPQREVAKRIRAVGASEPVLQLAPESCLRRKEMGAPAAATLLVPAATETRSASSLRRVRTVVKESVRRLLGALKLDHPRAATVLSRVRRSSVQLDARTKLLTLTEPAERALREGSYGVLVRPDGDRVGLPPAYVKDVATAAGYPLGGGAWSMAPIGRYRSQKVVFMRSQRETGEPDLVVKVTRVPEFSGRLRNEARALSRLERVALPASGVVPRAVFSGDHAGRFVLGQEAIRGRPFRVVSSGTPTCPYARSMAEWLAQLGIGTRARPQGGNRAVAEPLRQLLHRFTSVYRPPSSWRDFLARQFEALSSTPVEIPTVLQHGDPGNWNLLVTSDQRIGVLDWEAAELEGLPLWDLLYFLHTYAMWAFSSRGLPRTERMTASIWVEETDFTPLLVSSVESYVRRVGVPREAVIPLFYAAWMHRALKESTRLERRRLSRGRYVQLLGAMIEQEAALLLRQQGALR